MKVTIQVQMGRRYRMKKANGYKTFDKEFNDDRHLSNWVALMERKGCKIIGITPHEDAETRSTRDQVQAQEDAYFDNFCSNNNI